MMFGVPVPMGGRRTRAKSSARNSSSHPSTGGAEPVRRAEPLPMVVWPKHTCWLSNQLVWLRTARLQALEYCSRLCSTTSWCCTRPPRGSCSPSRPREVLRRTCRSSTQATPGCRTPRTRRRRCLRGETRGLPFLSSRCTFFLCCAPFLGLLSRLSRSG